MNCLRCERDDQIERLERNMFERFFTFLSATRKLKCVFCGCIFWADSLEGAQSDVSGLEQSGR